MLPFFLATFVGENLKVDENKHTKSEAVTENEIQPSVEESPLKKIILTHILDKNCITRRGKWEDSYEQLIHVEPRVGGGICGVVMETIQNGGKYDVKVDLKFENETSDYYIDSTSTKTYFTEKVGGEYDWDLRVAVKKVERGQTPPPFIHHIFTGLDLKKGDFIDLEFDPVGLSYGVNLAEDEKDKITRNRICRIGLH